MNAQLKNAVHSFRLWVMDTGKQLIIAIFIVLILRSSFIEPYKIPSGSMIPTLFIGDHIFVNKLSYGLKLPFTEWIFDAPIYVSEQKLPTRGDVIVFRWPRNESLNYIKRVIGLPGDTIAIREKILYINDKPMAEVPWHDSHLMSGIDNDQDKARLTLYKESLCADRPLPENIADCQKVVEHPILQDGKSLHQSDYGPRTIPEDRIFVLGDNRDRSSDSRYWGEVPLKNIKGKAMFVWLNLVIDFSNPQFRPERIATVIQ